MNLIKQNALAFVDGNYLDGHKLFSGVAFDIRDDCAVSAFVYESGAQVGEYEGEYFKVPTEGSCVDGTSNPSEWDLDERKLTATGEPFTGVVYEFDQQYCIREALYQNGSLLKEVRRNRAGRPTQIYLEEGNVYQYYTWHLNGCRHVSKVGVGPKSESEVEVQFNEHEELILLRLRGGATAALSPYLNVIALMPVCSIEDLVHLVFAEKVFFSGDGINDHAFQCLITAGKFDRVAVLTLFNVALSVAMFTQMEHLQSLMTVDVTDDGGRLSDAVRLLKHKRSHLHVCLNESTISLT